MNRVNLFEFTDMPWYPRAFRRIQTDHLQFVATRGAGHGNLVPLIKGALAAGGTTEIVDLCSGGTGPWERLVGQLASTGIDVEVKLTDLYPDQAAATRPARGRAPAIEYLAEPVDAASVPAHLTGMRTLFEASTTSSRIWPRRSCATLWPGGRPSACSRRVSPPWPRSVHDHVRI